MSIRFIALFVLAALSTPTWAQATSIGQQMIDGSRTPLLIPDREAYMMLFLDLADGSSTRPLSDRLSDLTNAGLTPAEAAAAIATANRYKTAYDSVILKMKQIKAAAPAERFSPQLLAQFDALFAQGWGTLAGIKLSLENTLGANAAGLLQSYVNTNIKPHLSVVSGK